MRYTDGDVYKSLDTPDEPDWQIEEAIVTDERVAIDWTEDDEPWVLIATSTDGGNEYTGHYGIEKPEYGAKISLWRYETKSGHGLLLGEYHDHEDGSGGWCMFELHPS